MKKTFKYYFSVWAILLILFNAVAFVSGGVTNLEKYTVSFWVGYIFITLAFIGQLMCAKVAFEAKNLTKLFYNIPLITISWTGLVVSFLFAGLCMLFSPLPYWVGVVVCVISFSMTAIAVVKANIVADEVSKIDEKVKAQTFFVKSLTVDAEGLLARAQSEDIKTECKKVYEAVRYSDPMSHEVLGGVESQITLKFAELVNAVDNADAIAVTKSANEVCVLVDDRNKKCRLLK